MSGHGQNMNISRSRHWKWPRLADDDLPPSPEKNQQTKTRKTQVWPRKAERSQCGDVAQLEHRTVMPLTQVRFPGAAWDFSPSVNFQCRFSYACPYIPCAIALINICAHVKDPIVRVRVRWIIGTLKHPTCPVGWVARLCRSWLSPGQATRISHGRNPIGTTVAKKKSVGKLSKLWQAGSLHLSPSWAKNLQTWTQWSPPSTQLWLGKHRQKKKNLGHWRNSWSVRQRGRTEKEQIWTWRFWEI